MDDDAPDRRPTKLLLAAVGLFVLAVVLGRLLVAGGAAWVLFALALPVLLFVLSAALGGRAAFALTAAFTAAVLVARWFLRNNPAGWVALLLLPVVALTALLVGKVVALSRRGPEPPEPEADETTGSP